MNRFSYYITTQFITNNKDYNSCHNPHSMYQTYLKFFDSCIMYVSEVWMEYMIVCTVFLYLSYPFILNVIVISFSLNQ